MGLKQTLLLWGLFRLSSYMLGSLLEILKSRKKRRTLYKRLKSKGAFSANSVHVKLGLPQAAMLSIFYIKISP